MIESTTFEEALQPVIDEYNKSGDPYLIVHFSRADDYYYGCNDRMDFADALIVIKYLVEFFKIDREVLIETFS